MHAFILPLLLSGLFTAGPSAGAPDAKSGLLTRTVKVGGESYTYQVFIPASLAGKKDVPVILFLHGIGQRGEGGFLPAGGAAGTCSRYWHDPEMERMILAELEQTASEFSADPKRLYLAGVSMGGFGAWHLAAENPGKFAAVVNVCGGSILTNGDRFTPVARQVGKTPVWVFHGSEDRVVPVTESRGIVEALKRVEGSRVRYSEYEGVGHNVWLKVASEPGLLPWLLAQRAD